MEGPDKELELDPHPCAGKEQKASVPCPNCGTELIRMVIQAYLTPKPATRSGTKLISLCTSRRGTIVTSVVPRLHIDAQVTAVILTCAKCAMMWPQAFEQQPKVLSLDGKYASRLGSLTMS